MSTRNFTGQMIYYQVFSVSFVILGYVVIFLYKINLVKMRLQHWVIFAGEGRSTPTQSKSHGQVFFDFKERQLNVGDFDWLNATDVYRTYLRGL